MDEPLLAAFLRKLIDARSRRDALATTLSGVFGLLTVATSAARKRKGRKKDTKKKGKKKGNDKDNDNHNGRRKKKRNRNKQGNNATDQNPASPPPPGDPGASPPPISSSPSPLPPVTDATARRPFPQHVAYAGGAILPSDHGQNQRDDDVRLAYDRWKERYLVPVDNGAQYRVAFAKPGEGGHGTTVSEGQGYGMVTVPHLAGHDPQAQAIFDGLWRYALAHRSCNENRLMLWRIPNNGHGCASANDGDLDIAYGLLLADAQWGSGGAIDYRAAAGWVMDGIRERTVGPQSNLPMLGDWVNANGSPQNQWTPRTSDFMTGHFRAFARATGDAIWNAVAEASLDVVQSLQQNYSPNTGLLPDFVQPASDSDHAPRPASPNFLEKETDGAFNYNAGRDPWRLGTDALLNGDARALAAVRKISAWAEAETNGDPQQIRAGYSLDGEPLPNSDYFTSFFAAPLGVAARTMASQQAWLNALYDAVRQRQENYYEDSVALLCLLVMTGNFWDPTA